MRGFTKAAALLSSTIFSASAFVIPDTGSLSVGDSTAVVEYRGFCWSHYCHLT